MKEDDDDCTRQVYEICKKQNIFSHSLILSFHPRQLQLLKEWDPSIFIQCFPPRYLKCPVDENLYGPVFNKICLWTKEATNEEIEAYRPVPRSGEPPRLFSAEFLSFLCSFVMAL